MASILEILLRAKGGEQVKSEMGKANKAAQQSSKIFSALGAMLSVGILAKGIKDSIAAYKIQELAVTKLNSALRAQGIMSEEVSKKFQTQASALQGLTIFGDEAILQGQAFAMSMGVQADTVEKITPLVLDFASAMGIDLRTAFRVMGQAAAGDTGMLKRYGIIVDEAALKSDGFNAVISTMQKNFEGTAEAIAKSGIGPMEQFKNLMGDFKEDIGRTVIPVINKLIELFMKFGGSLQNKEVEESGNIWKRVTEIRREGNLTLQQQNILTKLVSDGNEKALKIFLKNNKKEVEKEKEKTEIKVENSKAWEERLEKEQEKERAEREKTAKEEVDSLEDFYRLKQELGQLGLEDVITNLEKELELVSNSEEKKKALYEALDRYKHSLRVEEQVEIEEMNDRISELFVDATKDWGSAWNSFRDYIVDFILKEIANELVKTLVLGKALKTILGGISGGGFLGALGTLLPFQGGGTVPGPVGQPRPILAHGGETVTPVGGATTQGTGRGITFVFNISGTFLEADETKWQRLWREKLKPEMQRELRKTGESFKGT